jgi:tetratricopeptide (TPR) repeat protein
MNVVIYLAAGLVAAVAAAGILRPFQGGNQLKLERQADALEDERLSLLRALRDLEEERAVGALSDVDYRTLRAETETRAVAVLRALEARDGAGDLAVALKEVRASTPAARGPMGSSNGQGPEGMGVVEARAKRRWITSAAIGLVAVALVVPVLLHSIGSRTNDAPITGGVPTGTANDALAFFMQRVQDHPNDIAARLDLADRYLQTGNIQGAIEQYLSALKIDDRNPEARAALGFVLYRAGRPEEGLQAVDQALEVLPNYPEALYDKGVILLNGLNRPADAVAAFEAYLKAATYGSHGTEVQQLLNQAKSSSG